MVCPPPPRSLSHPSSLPASLTRCILARLSFPVFRLPSPALAVALWVPIAVSKSAEQGRVPSGPRVLGRLRFTS